MQGKGSIGAGDNGVIMISYYDFPSYVGISRRMEGLLHVLTRNGVLVRVLCPIFHRSKPLGTDGNSYEMEYIDLRWLRALGHNSTPVKFLAALIFSYLAFLRIVRMLRRGCFIVQFQTMYSALPAILAKVFVKSTVIGDDIGLLHTNQQPPRSWILRAIDLLVLRFTDVIVTFSVIDHAFIRQKFGSKQVLVVPNGVIVPLAETRRKVEQSKILLFVGSLTFAHNLVAVGYILKTAEGLLKRRDDFEVLIVGGPSDSVSHLMNHPLVQSGKVKFLGYVPNKTLNGLFKSAYIGLLPFFRGTPHFGQRTKALEYFANGLLVVSGPEGVRGIRGLKPGVHYLLAESVDQMSKIVDKCLSEPGKHENIATAGTKYVSENYSWETLTRDYIHHILNL